MIKLYSKKEIEKAKPAIVKALENRIDFLETELELKKGRNNKYLAIIDEIKIRHFNFLKGLKF